MLIMPVQSYAHSASPGMAEEEVHVLPYYLRNDDETFHLFSLNLHPTARLTLWVVDKPFAGVEGAVFLW